MRDAIRVQRKRRRAESGFTLIELLVVIAILGVLAGIVIFNVTGVSDRGQAAACNTDVASIQAALDGWRNDHRAANGTPAPAPPDQATLFADIVPNYVRTTPTACHGGYAIDASGTVHGTP
jgi:general secretion pathway protein G